MDWEQTTVTIESSAGRSILITDSIVKACLGLARIQVGFLHLFLRHTSASLTINENADSDVRRDLDMALHHIVPDRLDFRHTAEGKDDMPAHVKSSLMGVSLQIPINQGKLLLGTWQGIYLCEHRSLGHNREIVCTIYGRS
ncbi:MAG TPA: secondary thiamine-phosphate synthase enzyme YjbQ [Oligoflexus sp.]|uniref:secondary thiamine-phosphate synthase enzyme YjbQ n=1 Tax=Oligoflexus sp. TaxID=1971216 RepID=UPI002D67EEC9|nr:secondary thiamine-phosphate synthase enzyme YjbQ [Oligoflexus sp.]HYX33861.1 secondary thiamine-phosphate synthase enzyme YjbQ [Oligoflexus sp.]